MNRTTALKFGLLAASTLFSIVLLEVCLRLINYGEWVPVIDVDDKASSAMESGWLREDRTLFWRIAEVDKYCRSIKHVHPDNDSITKDPQGKTRIICIGDSCTFLPDMQTKSPPYPVALEGVMADQNVEVLCAALPGYSSHQGRAWIESELLEYQPTLVIVYFGWNDHWRSHGMTDREYAKTLELSPLRIERLWTSIAGSQTSKSTFEKPLRVPLDEYEDNLRQIHRKLSDEGVKSLFVTAPVVRVPEARQRLIAANHLDPQNDYLVLHESYNQVVRKLATENLVVLDLAKAFRGLESPASYLMADGYHLADDGIKFTAELLRDFINERQLLE